MKLYDILLNNSDIRNKSAYSGYYYLKVLKQFVNVLSDEDIVKYDVSFYGNNSSISSNINITDIDGIDTKVIYNRSNDPKDLDTYIVSKSTSGNNHTIFMSPGTINLSYDNDNDDFNVYYVGGAFNLNCSINNRIKTEHGCITYNEPYLAGHIEDNGIIKIDIIDNISQALINGKIKNVNNLCDIILAEYDYYTTIKEMANEHKKALK